MPREADNRIYIFHDAKDFDKALNLKHRLIESYFDKVLDIRIMNPEDDLVMSNAYGVRILPTVIFMDSKNKEKLRYEALGRSFDEVIMMTIKREFWEFWKYLY